MPSRPMLTMPARSENKPPSPARRMGTDRRRAALEVELEVRPAAPGTRWAIETTPSTVMIHRQ